MQYLLLIIFIYLHEYSFAQTDETPNKYPIPFLQVDSILLTHKDMGIVKNELIVKDSLLMQKILRRIRRNRKIKMTTKMRITYELTIYFHKNKGEGREGVIIGWGIGLNNKYFVSDYGWYKMRVNIVKYIKRHSFHKDS